MIHTKGAQRALTTFAQKTKAAEGEQPRRPSFRANPIVRGELRDDLGGLAQRHDRDWCEHHAGGEERVELGHGRIFRVVFSHWVRWWLGDDLRGLIERRERDGGQQKR